KTLSDVGPDKDVVEAGEKAAKDAGRDWGKKGQEIITTIKDNQAAKSRQYVGTTGGGTEHAIGKALETAFKDPKIETLERFASENWTTERLRVKVLDIVKAELHRLLFGTNRGNVPMQQLNELIQRAAQMTYARIFEVSELLAANRESAQFVQLLYRTH